MRIVLLQDLAALQPQYPSLPFYSHAPLYGPDWDHFALLVQANAVASAPQSLLLQEALPELSSVLESTREALLHNSSRLANRLEVKLEGLQVQFLGLQGQLQGLQGSLNALFQGQVPIPVTFTGYLGGPQTPPVPAPTPAGPVVPVGPVGPVGLVPAMGSPPSTAPTPSPPVYMALAKAYTVRDVWREWAEGLAGQPAVRELEERWGAKWRPCNIVRVQFCRRKVIWDEIPARVARGKSEEEAITELELLRAGRSLNQLVDELKYRQRHQYRLGANNLRGQGGRGRRWALYGRRGGSRGKAQ